MLARKVVFKERQVENELLELTDKDSIYFLGPGLTLNHCEVVTKVTATNLLIRERSRFINCTFEIKTELKNHQDWVFASIKGCRFKGRLMGCDFGSWPSYSEGSAHGFIEDCDFTEARMDACRIMDCDLATLRFPKWPCFTFLDPLRWAPDLRAAQWPGIFGSVIVGDIHTHPAPTKALTYYAPAVAKRMETTPEELRAVIEQFDCIVF